jgi:hypothetical protein
MHWVVLECKLFLLDKFSVAQSFSWSPLLLGPLERPENGKKTLLTNIGLVGYQIY